MESWRPQYCLKCSRTRPAAGISNFHGMQCDLYFALLRKLSSCLYLYVLDSGTPGYHASKPFYAAHAANASIPSSREQRPLFSCPLVLSAPTYDTCSPCSPKPSSLQSCMAGSALICRLPLPRLSIPSPAKDTVVKSPSSVALSHILLPSNILLPLSLTTPSKISRTCLHPSTPTASMPSNLPT